MKKNKSLGSIFGSLNANSKLIGDIFSIHSNMDFVDEASHCPAPFNELILLHSKTCNYIHKNWPSAYTSQVDTLNCLLRFPFDKNYLPVLYSLLKDLLYIANRADFIDPDSKKLEDATRILMKAFTVCLNDRAEMDINRKWGVYFISCLLFKSYIALNTPNLAKNVLRALEFSDLPPVKSFLKSHIVTYKFYVGLYYFWNENYEKAMYEFLFSFHHCHMKAKKNKSIILRYLLPIALLHGYFPFTPLLARHSQKLSLIYQPLINSLKKGNMALFNKIMEINENTLLNTSTFLIVEKLRIICLRSLVRRVYLLSDRTTRLPIQSIQISLKLCGVDVDMDEVECLVANLIAKNLLKGYISHERSTIVLSKENPFPSVNQVVTANGVGVL